ncbi:hypothetical protein NEUTE2DRAFT_71792, partial [Neurospora tetrasperma FGSC 2509]
KKYEFYNTKTKFLNFIIKRTRVSVDLKKVKVIKKWTVPSNFRRVRSFLGFYNFY